MKAVWPTSAVGGGYQVNLTSASGDEAFSSKTEPVGHRFSTCCCIQDKPASTRTVGLTSGHRTVHLTKQFFGRHLDLFADKRWLGGSRSKEGRLEVSNECKTEQGACGAYLEDVPHLVDWLGKDLPVSSSVWSVLNFLHRQLLGLFSGYTCSYLACCGSLCDRRILTRSITILLMRPSSKNH